MPFSGAELSLLEWLAAEEWEAMPTFCPVSAQLVDAGLADRKPGQDGGVLLSITAKGRAVLRQARTRPLASTADPIAAYS